MPSIEQLTRALQNADAAGDVEAAKQLAKAVREMQAGEAQKPTSWLDNGSGVLDAVQSAAEGAANVVTLGLDDEIAAGAGAIGGMLPGGHGKGYSELKAEINADNRKVSDAHPALHLAGQIGGGAAMGAGMAARGLSMGANAAAAKAGLGAVARWSAVDGAVMGGLSGAGNGEGVGGRAVGAAVGGLGGGLFGFAAPIAVSGVGKALSGLSAPFLARIMPERYANRAVGQAIDRSGKSVEELATDVERARADGQDMFNLADALGPAGNRPLAAIARTPNDARQQVAETLTQRQMSQGERLSAALADGFEAPDTAAQRLAGLTQARNTEANALYGAARNEAGAVNVTPILKEIDKTLSPGVSKLASPRDNIANDSIEGALARVRGMISDGKSNLTDFNALFRAKLDLDDMIARADAQGAGNRAHYLTAVQRQIDDALAAASAPYAKARDAFAAGSRRMEAVGEGSAATSGRTRAPDNIDRFSRMSPEEQSAFRAGYADPMIARVEAASIAPSTNKARMLATEKTGQEFPAFAAPGKADQLGDRIARETRMFQTWNAALGGSKTADNISDIADLNKIDPAIVSNLLRGNVPSALMAAVAKTVNEFGGTPPAVTSELAKALLETRPDLIRGILTGGAENTASQRALQAAVASALTSSAASGIGRLPAP